jgi:hypothetical protein
LLEKFKDSLLTEKAGNAKIPPHKPLLNSDAISQYSKLYIISESLEESTRTELERLTKDEIVCKAEKMP